MQLVACIIYTKYLFYLSICIPFYLSIIYLYNCTHPSPSVIFQPIYIYIYIPITICIYLSIFIYYIYYIYVYIFIYISICLSVYLSITIPRRSTARTCRRKLLKIRETSILLEQSFLNSGTNTKHSN